MVGTGEADEAQAADAAGAPASARRPRARDAARRRRENFEGGRRSSHRVTVSPAEELQLRVRADSLGYTVPRLLVEAALADHGETVSDRRDLVATLLQVSRLLGAVSNNVNQIARATNATGELQEDTAATLAAVRKVASRVEKVVDELAVAR
ncbi:MobC family plasmid mobilization relaxosome protein [Isoptericola sp. NPDC055881]